MRIDSIPIQIRFRDIDMNHHVNNAVYFTYMENAGRPLAIPDWFTKKYLEKQSKKHT